MDNRGESLRGGVGTPLRNSDDETWLIQFEAEDSAWTDEYGEYRTKAEAIAAGREYAPEWANDNLDDGEVAAFLETGSFYVGRAEPLKLEVDVPGFLDIVMENLESQISDSDISDRALDPLRRFICRLNYEPTEQVRARAGKLARKLEEVTIEWLNAQQLSPAAFELVQVESVKIRE